MPISRKKSNLNYIILVISFLNLLFFNLPFLKFGLDNINLTIFSGKVLFVSLIILVLIANFFAFYLFYYISTVFGKICSSIFFLISSIAVYFINTYSVIIDESMIGNILNTNFDESSSFFSFKLVVYFLFLGIIPTWVIWKIKVVKPKFKIFITTIFINLLFIAAIVAINASNVLWIDKHSKVLGGLAMPWSYNVNIIRFYAHKHQENKKEILLPDATIANNEKSVVILVIGESARSANFSLYGYNKNTNPLLSKVEGLHHFNANSCATYTTAALKCLLEHQNTNDLYEILPNYLYRNNVDVIWRTTNWGEPPVHIEKYFKAEDLVSRCQGEGCKYDEILLTGLKDDILKSDKDKILIILHTSTSHGPTYSTKYPSQFETFKPVCNSVELSNCTKEELINAYDNTIVYTDYLLHEIIEELKQLKDYKSTMIYVSDHGESLGEKNLYMHGVPMSMAPKEQYEIPFIVWTSDNSKKLKQNDMLSQNHVFHSVLDFLSIQSPIYNPNLSVYVNTP